MDIIDGHKLMLSIHITQVSGPTIKSQDALKLCQGVLAAKRSVDKQGRIPKEVVEGANLFKMDEKEIKETINKYCEDNPKPAKIIEKYEDVSDESKLADKIFKNLMDLRKRNEKFANKGNERGVMPQTDKGGNKPNEHGDKTSAYDKKGSALYAMTHGKIDPKTVK